MDDLSSPLGQGTLPKRRRGILRVLGLLLTAALSLFVVLLAGWALVADDPLGGQPKALVAVPPARGPDAAHAGVPAATTGPTADAAPPTVVSLTSPPGRTVTIIDGTSGKRHEIVLPAPVAGDNPADLDERPIERSRQAPLSRARSPARAAQPTSPASGG